MREERSKARMDNNNATTFDAAREASAVRVQTLDLLFQIHEVLLGPVCFLKSDSGVFRDEAAKFRHRVDDRLNRRRDGSEESLHIPRNGREVLREIEGLVRKRTSTDGRRRAGRAGRAGGRGGGTTIRGALDDHSALIVAA
eukprot:8416817-Pyramimonas_sp.AAC.1